MMKKQRRGVSNRVSRRSFLRMSAVGVSAAFLASCAAPAADQGGDGEAPAAEQVTVTATINHALTSYDPVAYDLAAERVPEVELVIDQTPFGGGWDGYADNIITRMAGGEKLDIIYMAIEGMPLMTEQGTIVPLGEFLEADVEAKEELEEDIHPRLWEVLTWKDDLMLLPYGWNNMLCWYNPTIFADKDVAVPEDPWTWSDFVERCQSVADVTGSDSDLFAFSWFDSAFGMAPWYFNNNTSWLKNDWSDSNLDDPKVAETLQFLADLINEYNVSPLLAGWDEAGQFHSNNLAMRGCGRWCVGQAQGAEFTSYNFDYYPHNDGPLKTVVGVGGWGIVKDSENPQVSWQVISDVLLSQEQELSFISTVGSVPSRRTVAESETFLDAGPEGVDMRIFYESLDTADVVPSPPNFNVVDPLLQRWYSQLWSGEISVDELVTGAHEELQTEMDKLKS